MSSIPPAWLSSGIQALGAQKKAAEERDRLAVDAARKAADSPFAREEHDAIEASDRDSQVDADGAGAGGQGRAFSSESPSDGANDEATDARKHPANASNQPPGIDMQA